jgi:hypothetical protein
MVKDNVGGPVDPEQVCDAWFEQLQTLSVECPEVLMTKATKVVNDISPGLGDDMRDRLETAAAACDGDPDIEDEAACCPVDWQQLLASIWSGLASLWSGLKGIVEFVWDGLKRMLAAFVDLVERGLNAITSEQASAFIMGLLSFLLKAYTGTKHD